MVIGTSDLPQPVGLEERVGRQEHVDLHHHGDADVRAGMVDLAVNVAPGGTPDWLVHALTQSLTELHRYPDPTAARAMIAVAHGVEPESVLVTSGAAEAFTLVARARPWRRPVVLHPQFTEPEAALRAAGHAPDRVLLSADDGFVLSPRIDLVDAGADLIMIGNPTNPTSVLHPAATIHSLVHPGRVVVVDEAFGDAVPGEPETMIIPARLDGVLVVRSLTKTWAMPGLRAGYVVGDPALIIALSRQQPPWSVSGPALAAITAVLSDRARAEAAAYARQIGTERDRLCAELGAVGLTPVAAPRAPFVLVDTAGWLTDPRPDAVRHELAAAGFAVRRGETFPGLGPSWIRMAVRDRATSASLGTALARIKERDGG